MMRGLKRDRVSMYSRARRGASTGRLRLAPTRCDGLDALAQREQRFGRAERRTFQTQHVDEHARQRQVALAVAELRDQGFQTETQMPPMPPNTSAALSASILKTLATLVCIAAASASPRRARLRTRAQAWNAPANAMTRSSLMAARQR